MKGSYWQWALQRAYYATPVQPYYDRGRVYPVAWNVKLRGNGPTFEQVFTLMAKDNYHNMADALLRCRGWEGVRDNWEWWLSSTTNFILESMQSSFLDDDWPRMLCPEIANRYSLPDDTTFSISYEFRGRSGGYLVIDKFQDVTLDEATIKVPNHVARDLAACIEEVTRIVECREDEFAYQAAFQLYNELQGQS